MTPSGVDTHFAVRSPHLALGWMVRNMRRLWPDAVFKTDDDTVLTNPDAAADGSGMLDRYEMLVFKDQQIADRWSAEGAVPALYNTMVHFLSEPGMLTVVVDDINHAEMKIVLAAMSQIAVPV